MPYIVKSTKTLPQLADALNAVVHSLVIPKEGLPLAGLTLTFTTPAATCVFPSATLATITSGNAETYALTDGMTLQLKLSGGEVQTALFETADFVGIGVATAAEVVAVLAADIPGVTAVDDAGSVRLDSNVAGRDMTIEVLGGTANAALGFAAGEVSGSGDPSGLMTVPEILAALNTSLNGDAVYATSQPYSNDGRGGQIIKFMARLALMEMTLDATSLLFGFKSAGSGTSARILATDIVHAGEGPDGFFALYFETD